MRVVVRPLVFRRVVDVMCADEWWGVYGVRACPCIQTNGYSSHETVSHCGWTCVCSLLCALIIVMCAMLPPPFVPSAVSHRGMS